MSSMCGSEFALTTIFAGTVKAQCRTRWSILGAGAGRVILHQEKPHSTTPCGLADSYYPNHGGFSVKIGITNICTPAVPITYGQWYHVQFAVQTGSNASFRLWVNNNNLSSPSSVKTGFSMTTEQWNDSWDFGGFITDSPSRDQGFVVDDFQVGLSFDPNWNQGGSTVTPPPPPPPAVAGTNGLPWSASFSAGNFSEWNRGFNAGGNLSVVAGGQSGSAARATLVAGTENPNTYAEQAIGDYYSLPSPKTKVEEMWMVMWSKFDAPYHVAERLAEDLDSEPHRRPLECKAISDLFVCDADWRVSHRPCGLVGGRTFVPVVQNVGGYSGEGNLQHLDEV